MNNFLSNEHVMSIRHEIFFTKIKVKIILEIIYFVREQDKKVDIQSYLTLTPNNSHRCVTCINFH